MCQVLSQAAQIQQSLVRLIYKRRKSVGVPEPPVPRRPAPSDFTFSTFPVQTLSWGRPASLLLQPRLALPHPTPAQAPPHLAPPRPFPPHPSTPSLSAPHHQRPPPLRASLCPRLGSPGSCSQHFPLSSSHHPRGLSLEAAFSWKPPGIYPSEITVSRGRQGENSKVPCPGACTEDEH